MSDFQEDLFAAQVEARAEARALEIQREREAQLFSDPEYLQKALLKQIEVSNSQAKQLEAAAPKVEFADEVMQSEDWQDMLEVSKLLSRHEYGQKQLFGFLRASGILMKSASHWNIPYQQYVNAGYFKTVETPWTDPKTGQRHITQKTVVSQRGIEYINKLLKEVG